MLPLTFMYLYLLGCVTLLLLINRYQQRVENIVLKKTKVMLQISFNLRGETRDQLIETVVAYKAHPIKIGLNKKSDPKQKTIQTFNIDVQRFR